VEQLQAFCFHLSAKIGDVMFFHNNKEKVHYE